MVDEDNNEKDEGRGYEVGEGVRDATMFFRLRVMSLNAGRAWASHATQDIARLNKEGGQSSGTRGTSLAVSSEKSTGERGRSSAAFLLVINSQMTIPKLYTSAFSS